MPTSPCLDINLTTPACVLWESDTTTRSLIESDPPTRDVLFECHFDVKTTAASFTIHCPIRLKGIDSHSQILGLVPPYTITSFSFKPYPKPPESIRKKLNCSTLRLRFDLDRPLQLIAPVAATEPVQPRKRLSAEALNTLRSLATATCLDIYVSDRELPHIKLNTIREAVAQSLLRPFDSNLSNTLAALYSGRGGKLIDLSLPVSTSENDEPPAYDELEPSPPSTIEHTPLAKAEPLLPVAQAAEFHEKKRRRLDESSYDEIDKRPDLAWAVVVEMREEMQKLVKRVEQLEKENKELSEELDVLRASCEKATDGVNADEAAILEVQNDLDELADRVDFLTKNGLDSDVEESIIKKVTGRAVTNILEKSYKLSFEEN